MTTLRTRSVFWSSILGSVAAATLVFSTPALAAAKKAKPAPAAKKKPGSENPAKDASAAKATPAGATWEAPPRDAVEGAPPAAPAPAAPAPVAAPAPAPEPKPEPAPAPVAAPAPEPAPETAMPSFADPPKPQTDEPASASVSDSVAAPASQSILYVEHLGPSSYPGKRGLYGGSLFLEPSFDGLQWPRMTRTGVGVSGSVWVDNGYASISRESEHAPDTTRLLQQGRATLRVTPTYAYGDYFIQGQLEVIANNCQSTGTTKCDQAGRGTVDTDDLWIRVGRWNVWDLKVGRFEGWEMFHTGMGLDINTLERRGAQREGTSGNTLDAPDIYTMNFLHDRPTGMGIGYAAYHHYFGNFLRLEALGELGTDEASGSGSNIWGFRPSLIAAYRFVKLKWGGEYEKTTHGTQYLNSDPDKGKVGKVYDKFNITRKGTGGSLQFVFDPYVEFGGNLAYARVKEYDKEGSQVAGRTYTRVSYGVFANLKVGSLLRAPALEDLMVGGGYYYTWNTDEQRLNSDPDSNFTDHIQAFGAIQYMVLKQLYIKAVFAYANAFFQPTDSKNQPDNVFSNVAKSVRLRMMYLF
jgi:hypothetical protein